MDQFEFAQNLIRAPLLQRLTDRTFVGTIGTALGAVGAAIAIWNTNGVPITDKVNLTGAAFVAIAGVVGAWSHGEKKKDSAVAVAVLQASTPKMPESVAIGTVTDNGAGTALPPIAAAVEPDSGFDLRAVDTGATADGFSQTLDETPTATEAR